MRVLLACFLSQALWAAPVSAQEIRQRIRTEALDPNTNQMTVEVTGAPGLTTSIRLPDSFSGENVRCGECLEPHDAGEASSQDAEGGRPPPRMWYLEKRIEDRALYLRPARMPVSWEEAAQATRRGIPDAQFLPPSAFTTNIFVGLDGGYAVNITLRLVDLERQRSNPQADAIVTLTSPQSLTLTGRLAEERNRQRATFRDEVQAEAMRMFLGRLEDDVRCRKVGWRRPHRKDAAVVRINQLCASGGSNKTFWATFEVENRSEKTLYIESAELEPETAVETTNDSEPFMVPRGALQFGDTGTGIALRTLATHTTLTPSTWRLRVIPASPDREPVDIEGLVF